jgi:hypothetical protein
MGGPKSLEDVINTNLREGDETSWGSYSMTGVGFSSVKLSRSHTMVLVSRYTNQLCCWHRCRSYRHQIFLLWFLFHKSSLISCRLRLGGGGTFNLWSPLYKSRDSSVGIALGYRLDDRGSRVRFPAEAGNFSLCHRVQNGSGAHPASYPMGTRGSSPGGKAAGAWSWPLTSI